MLLQSFFILQGSRIRSNSVSDDSTQVIAGCVPLGKIPRAQVGSEWSKVSCELFQLGREANIEDAMSIEGTDDQAIHPKLDIPSR